VAITTCGSLVLHGCGTDQQSAPRAPDHRDAEYVLGGQRVRLANGVAEIEAAPGSATKISTRYYGNEARHDLNADGKEDVVFLLTQETGGSGVFYYVVAALAGERGFAGTQGVLLGDRIAPQTTEVGTDRIVTVSYADRAPGESFAVPPSQSKTIRLLLDTDTLQFGEVAQDFEGEANPATMTLDMKTWVWVSARFRDGTELLPRRADAFTLSFGADGKLTATTDCNRVGGSYAAADDALTFSDLFATRMYCEGSQENEFTRVLRDTTGYRFTSRGELVLDLGRGNGSAVFR
jgi:heat shock protein HslJ